MMMTTPLPQFKEAPFIFGLFLLAAITCSPGVAFCAEMIKEAGQVMSPKPTQQMSAPKKQQQRWAAFPLIASSPETGLMLGGMLFHFFPTIEPEEQASTIDLIAFGTTEGQYGLQITPNIFLQDGDYRLAASFFVTHWQADFYQIGNKSPDISEEYDSMSHGVNLVVERRLYESFIVDLIGCYEKNDMDIVADGMLDTGNILGAEDGEYIGVGAAFGYDSRDNTNAPAKGVLSTYEYISFDKDFGSSLDFDFQTLNLRYYTQTNFVKDSVIALAGQIKSSNGDVPFRYLPSPDGTNILRGIENGRYKDKKMASLQSEYRFPIYKKISGTVFVEFAQVADDFGDMKLDDTKTSIGSGVRYALNPEQRFNVRADIAWVDDGFGMIINIREAF